MIEIEPSISVRVTRRVRCSQVTSRPRLSTVLPFELLECSRKTETSPEGSTNRIMRLFGMSDQTRLRPAANQAGPSAQRAPDHKRSMRMTREASLEARIENDDVRSPDLTIPSEHPSSLDHLGGPCPGVTNRGPYSAPKHNLSSRVFLVASQMSAMLQLLDLISIAAFSFGCSACAHRTLHGMLVRLVHGKPNSRQLFRVGKQNAQGEEI
jgi:hypothetical protein